MNVVGETRLWDVATEDARSIAGAGRDLGFVGPSAFAPPSGDLQSPPAELNSPPVASFLNSQGYVLTGSSFRADTSFPLDSSLGGATYDKIDGFVSGTDKIDLPNPVAAVDSTVVGGALNSASFNTDLAAAIQSSQLQVGNAVLFTPDSGSLAGTTFLIVDANGVAGYQADADYVIKLLAPPPILQSSDFI